MARRAAQARVTGGAARGRTARGGALVVRAVASDSASAQARYDALVSISNDESDKTTVIEIKADPSLADADPALLSMVTATIRDLGLVVVNAVVRQQTKHPWTRGDVLIT